MTGAQRLLVAFYALVAVAALFATFSQDLQLPSTGPFGPYGAFMEGAKANPASRSITVDISFFLLAASVFMVIEARRLGMGLVWLYILGGFFIAISVAFPLFMIAREFRLAPGAKPYAPRSLAVADVMGLALVTSAVLAICWATLF